MDIEKISEPVNKVIDFVSDIIKPPVKEIIDTLFTDNVKYWRFKNQIRLLQKAEKYVKAKGINPKKIPIKTLVPLLEYSSLEEENSLKEMWTKLLVNSIDPLNTSLNQNIYIEILKQMSPHDAKILEFINKKVKHSDLNFRINFVSFEIIIKKFEAIPEKECYLILENLARLQLIEPMAPVQSKKSIFPSFSVRMEHSSYRLTHLGNEMIIQTS
ncbi:MAG: DUF4393 domain-containing protein [Chitinophagaceae bacterium]|nr:DUF4393 domain-containing protein [Chitinophagaceae bacterium]